MIVRPNPGPNFSAANYDGEGRRWKGLWPEITVLVLRRNNYLSSLRAVRTASIHDYRVKNFRSLQ